MAEATPLPTNPGLSHFLDRRNFVRTSVLAGSGLYIATSKTATAQQTSDERLLKVALVGAGTKNQKKIKKIT